MVRKDEAKITGERSLDKIYGQLQNGGRVTMPLKYFNQTAAGRSRSPSRSRSRSPQYTGGRQAGAGSRQTGGRVTMPLKYFNQTAAGYTNKKGTYFPTNKKGTYSPKNKKTVKPLPIPKPIKPMTGFMSHMTGGRVTMPLKYFNQTAAGLIKSPRGGGRVRCLSPSQRGGLPLQQKGKNIPIRSPKKLKRSVKPSTVTYFSQTAGACPFKRGRTPRTPRTQYGGGGAPTGAPLHIPDFGYNPTLHQTISHVRQIGAGPVRAPLYINQFGKGSSRLGDEFRSLYGNNRQTGGEFLTLYGDNMPTYNRL